MGVSLSGMEAKILDSMTQHQTAMVRVFVGHLLSTYCVQSILQIQLVKGQQAEQQVQGPCCPAAREHLELGMETRLL